MPPSKTDLYIVGNRLLIYRLLFFAWAACMTYFMVSPGGGLPPFPFMTWPYFDKIVHFGSFFLLSFLWELSALVRKPLIRIVFIGAGIFYGLAIEFVQLHVPGRTFEVLDMLANALGILSGYFVFVAMNNRKAT